MLKDSARRAVVAVLGGSGFVGRALANRLQAMNVDVRVLTRARRHTRELWPLPNVTCIELDVYDEQALATAFAGCAGVVNLVGILNERRDDGRDFRRAHVDLTQRALTAAVAARVPRFVQMSALGASPDAPSRYLRSRAEAEQQVLANAGLRTAILQPSVIFGPGDGLFCRFAELVRWLPCLPLAGADVRFQPVYVGDVATALERVLDNDHLPTGTRFELGGDAVWTLREIVEYTARHTGHLCPVLALPNWLGRVQAEICEHLPGKPFSRDNWRSLQRDSVVTGTEGLAVLGITPTPITAVMPQVLAIPRRQRAFDAHRRRARR
ncbi:MAG: complex I NDUFA9 subunit family protein [Gammaproteobacteria bacterium]